MKKLLLTAIIIATSVSLFAQLNFEIGIKAGVNFSKSSFDIDDYSAESVTKSHFGGFARVGFSRVFLQPEFYFSGKGGDVTSDISSTAASFDFRTFDVPVLFGYSLINGENFDFHVVAGPVFSNITSESVKGDNLLNKSFYEDCYYGVQYGAGMDIFFLTIDARLEQGIENFYTQPQNSVKNQNIMISVGLKF